MKMKRINVILLVAIITVAVLMYVTAQVGVRLERESDVWIAVTACYFAMAGLILSIMGFLVAIVSLASSRIRQTTTVIPILSLLASLTFIFGVFVIPIAQTIRHNERMKDASENIR